MSSVHQFLSINQTVDAFHFTGTPENLEELNDWLKDHDASNTWIKNRDKIKINLQEPRGTGKVVVLPGEYLVRFPNGDFIPFTAEFFSEFFHSTIDPDLTDYENPNRSGRVRPDTIDDGNGTILHDPSTGL